MNQYSMPSLKIEDAQSNEAKGTIPYAGADDNSFAKKVSKDREQALHARMRSPSYFTGDSTIGDKPQCVTSVLADDASDGDWIRPKHNRHAVFQGLRDEDDNFSSSPRVEAIPPFIETSIPVAARRTCSMPAPLQVTNPQRVIDSRTGTTKLELVRFYGLVGELMMKHLAGRPVSLLRAPNGVEAKLLIPRYMETGKIHGTRKLELGTCDEHPPVIEVASMLALLAAAQWNVVEFHTLNTSKLSLETPDRMVFDLDPGEGVAWYEMQEAAQLMYSFLAQLGLTSFLQTSGGKGLHVVVPVKQLHTWETVKGFAQAVIAYMVKTIPQRFVARNGQNNRVGKIFIDNLRNGFGSTTVCAWSARARPGLGISVPVGWEELKSLRGGDHWSVRTVHERLGVGNDPWTGYDKAALGLSAAMSALSYVQPPG